MDAILNDILIYVNVFVVLLVCFFFCFGVITIYSRRFVMHGSKFIFEELDQPSKDYLLAIGRNKGAGFPGVYIYNYNFGGAFLLTGIVFLGGIPFVNLVDTFAEPKAQAMLQTALFLLGGWFVMLWFRRKGYFSTASNLNSFIFVDEKYYWNWSHYSVDVINIENIKLFSLFV